MIEGYGNNPQDHVEGLRYRNFIGSTVGSVLIFNLVMVPVDWIGTLLVIISVLALNITPKSKIEKVDKIE